MHYDFPYLLSLFALPAFWQACVTVVELSALSWLTGLVLGFLLASAKLSRARWLSMPAAVYIWFFRSVPLLAWWCSSTTCRSFFPLAAWRYRIRSSPVSLLWRSRKPLIWPRFTAVDCYPWLEDSMRRARR